LIYAIDLLIISALFKAKKLFRCFETTTKKKLKYVYVCLNCLKNKCVYKSLYEMIVMCYVFNFLTIYALMIYCLVPYVKLMKFIYKKKKIRIFPSVHIWQTKC